MNGLHEGVQWTEPQQQLECVFCGLPAGSTKAYCEMCHALVVMSQEQGRASQVLSIMAAANLLGKRGTEVHEFINAVALHLDKLSKQGKAQALK